ncbi:MAG: hypothetical protein WCK67_11650 [bacterium]
MKTNLNLSITQCYTQKTHNAQETNKIQNIKPDSISFKGNHFEPILNLVREEVKSILPEVNNPEKLLIILNMEHHNISNPKDFTKAVAGKIAKMEKKPFQEMVEGFSNIDNIKWLESMFRDIAEFLPEERQKEFTKLADKAVFEKNNDCNPFKKSKNPILFNIGHLLGNVMSDFIRVDVEGRNSFKYIERDLWINPETINQSKK